MGIRIVYFTGRGGLVAARLHRGLLSAGYEAACFAPSSCLEPDLACSPLDVPIREWTGRHFEKGSGLIFIGAAGIAVRSIAPHLRGKEQDPAVAVVDEKGRFAISLLSGHLGGGNDLARLAASLIGAEPVITTATDLNGVFAVDLFALANGLAITDLPAAKRISAALLRGERIGFFSEFPVEGQVPVGLTVNQPQKENIILSVHKAYKEQSGLKLVPKAVTVGIGCRKATAAAAVKEAFLTVQELGSFHPASLAGLASIDLKKEEAGLLMLASELKVPLHFYTPMELSAAEGAFSSSEFVRQITGVSNVCERAAVCGCFPQGRLAVKKIAINGVTAAAAVAARTFTFDREEAYIDENRVSFEQ